MENEELKEPKIGEVVAVKIEDLRAIYITDLTDEDDFTFPEEYDINKFHYRFHLCEKGEYVQELEQEWDEYGFKDDFDEYFTLLRYEGSGVFTELYTNEKIAFRVEYLSDADAKREKIAKDYIFADKYGENASFDCAVFLKYYEELAEIPLSIEDWFPLTDEIRTRISYQEREAKNISDAILELMLKATEDLEECKKHTLVFDYDYALGENRIYDFIHNSDLITTNQLDEEKPKQMVKQDKH